VAEAVDVFYAVKTPCHGILHCLFSVQQRFSFSLLSGDKHVTTIESGGQYLDVVIIRKAETSAAEGAHLANKRSVLDLLQLTPYISRVTETSGQSRSLDAFGGEMNMIWHG
jgi:hypothetical protein